MQELVGIMPPKSTRAIRRNGANNKVQDNKTPTGKPAAAAVRKRRTSAVRKSVHEDESDERLSVALTMASLAGGGESSFGDSPPSAGTRQHSGKAKHDDVEQSPEMSPKRSRVLPAILSTKSAVAGSKDDLLPTTVAGARLVSTDVPVESPLISAAPVGRKPPQQRRSKKKPDADSTSPPEVNSAAVLADLQPPAPQPLVRVVAEPVVANPGVVASSGGPLSLAHIMKPPVPSAPAILQIPVSSVVSSMTGTSLIPATSIAGLQSAPIVMTPVLLPDGSVHLINMPINAFGAVSFGSQIILAPSAGGGTPNGAVRPHGPQVAAQNSPTDNGNLGSLNTIRQLYQANTANSVAVSDIATPPSHHSANPVETSPDKAGASPHPGSGGLGSLNSLREYYKSIQKRGDGTSETSTGSPMSSGGGAIPVTLPNGTARGPGRILPEITLQSGGAPLGEKKKRRQARLKTARGGKKSNSVGLIITNGGEVGRGSVPDAVASYEPVTPVENVAYEGWHLFRCHSFES